MRARIAEIVVPEYMLVTETDEFKEQVREIAESIKEVGLSHPLIVRPANTSLVLASGIKRLLAAQQLGLEEIEVEAREIDEQEGKVIRAHENLKRHNLPWWEQVELVEQLHALRQEQHGIAITGRPRRGEEKSGWGIRDTAEELGVALGPLSEDLNLARAVRLDPSLRNVKDKKTAVRLVRIAAQRVNAEEEASLPTRLDVNQVFFGDAESILKQLPGGCVDHAITDPPWINYFDKSLTIDARTLPVFKELYRVLRVNSFCYIFCGWDDFVYYCGYDIPQQEGEPKHIMGELEKIGYNVSKTPVVWKKENALSRRGVKSWEYDRDFEFVIVAAKGSPALVTSRRLSGHKSFPVVPVRNLIHPNEKPIDLIKDIITDCSYEGNIIIDPFAGSGVVPAACKETKRRYMACERDHKFYEKICSRLGAK